MERSALLEARPEPGISRGEPGAFPGTEPQPAELQRRFPLRVAEISEIATRVSEQTENIGARRLHTLLERLLEDVAYAAPEDAGRVDLELAYVRDELKAISHNTDLSTYTL